MDIALVPIRNNSFQTAVFGSPVSGTAVYNPAVTTQNSDGTASAITMTTPVLVTPAIQSTFTTIVYGPTIGMRWLRGPTTPRPNVIVDGEAFDIPIAQLTYNGMVPVGAPSDNEGHYYLPVEFDDGPHTVTVVLTPGPTAQTLTIFGWLADKKHYPREVPPILDPLPTIDLGTDPALPAAKIPRSASGANDLRGYGKILYANDTANPIVVRILAPATVAIPIGKTMWVKTIGPFDTEPCDLDDDRLVALNPNCVHYASAPGITCTVFGGW